MKATPVPPAPEQESVWDYPRPAVARPTSAHVTIEHLGRVVAGARAAVRTLETSHPPSYYTSRADIDEELLQRGDGTSFCGWKGAAVYWNVVIGGVTLPRVGWSYPRPTPPSASLRDHIAFYAAPFDHRTVDGEVVVAQPGGFYGGWTTSKVVGPFKGVPGSRGW